MATVKLTLPQEKMLGPLLRELGIRGRAYAPEITPAQAHELFEAVSKLPVPNTNAYRTQDAIMTKLAGVWKAARAVQS